MLSHDGRSAARHGGVVVAAAGILHFPVVTSSCGPDYLQIWFVLLLVRLRTEVLRHARTDKYCHSRVEPHIEHEHGGRQWMLRQPRDIAQTCTIQEYYQHRQLCRNRCGVHKNARGVVVGVDPVFPTVYYNPDPYT